jgi:hypothetical protein
MYRAAKTWEGVIGWKQRGALNVAVIGLMAPSGSGRWGGKRVHPLLMIGAVKVPGCKNMGRCHRVEAARGAQRSCYWINGTLWKWEVGRQTGASSTYDSSSEGNKPGEQSNLISM